MEVMANFVANFIPGDASSYDKTKEVEVFDGTKAGVKGLLDSGVTKIPRFFIHSPENVQSSSKNTSDIGRQIPVIDLEGFESRRRLEVVEEIRRASETWGFMQLVNHGVPVGVIDEMITGVRRFHEQSQEIKMEWYSRDTEKPVRYSAMAISSGIKHQHAGEIVWHLIYPTENWTLNSILRYAGTLLDAISEYIKHITRLSKTLSELLSEALGLPSDYLSSIECMETESFLCHYYPACPEPNITLGAPQHSDPSFVTILLQDNTGGLQVLTDQNEWIDVPPIHGAFIVNIGDMMQIITNEKFRSVEHRVRVGGVGARAAVACFLYPSTAADCKPYKAIKELLSDNPPMYRKVQFGEFMAYYKSKGSDGNSALPHFKRA